MPSILKNDGYVLLQERTIWTMHKQYIQSQYIKHKKYGIKSSIIISKYKK